MLPASFTGALNGVLGDHLVRSGNPLAIKAAFYRNGRPVDLLSPESTWSYPEWNGRVSIFLHGAAASEQHWQAGSGISFADRLYQGFRSLPGMLRYNSGRHISENGRTLTALFEEQLNHPSIREIIVIGHSMGGLVFRSASHYAGLMGHAWTAKVRHVFYLGSPHLGAPLENLGAWSEALLRQAGTIYTEIAARIIGLRSDGIKDLRHGYLTDGEWQSEGKHLLPVNCKVPSSRIGHLHRARHYLVAGTAHKDVDSLAADWFGDLMVRKNSATADCPDRIHHLPVEEEDIMILGGHHHVRLIRSEEVLAFILEKLSR